MNLDIQKNENNGGEYCFFSVNGKEYYADKAYVPDFMCQETMIFPAKDKKVTDWGELYCDRTNKPLKDCIKEFISKIKSSQK